LDAPRDTNSVDAIHLLSCSSIDNAQVPESGVGIGRFSSDIPMPDRLESRLHRHLRIYAVIAGRERLPGAFAGGFDHVIGGRRLRKEMSAHEFIIECHHQLDFLRRSDAKQVAVSTRR